jgi:hypothetical protein
MSKPFEGGAYVHRRLSLVADGKAHGNPAKDAGFQLSHSHRGGRSVTSLVSR